MRTIPKSSPTAGHTDDSWQVPRQERAARCHPQPLLAAEPSETLDIADVSALRMRIYITTADILIRGFGGERHIFLAASLTLARHYP